MNIAGLHNVLTGATDVALQVLQRNRVPAIRDASDQNTDIPVRRANSYHDAQLTPLGSQSLSGNAQFHHIVESHDMRLDYRMQAVKSQLEGFVGHEISVSNPDELLKMAAETSDRIHNRTFSTHNVDDQPEDSEPSISPSIETPTVLLENIDDLINGAVTERFNIRRITATLLSEFTGSGKTSTDTTSAAPAAQFSVKA